MPLASSSVKAAATKPAGAPLPPHSGAVARIPKPAPAPQADVFSDPDPSAKEAPATSATTTTAKTAAPGLGSPKKKAAAEFDYSLLRGQSEENLINALKDRDIRHRELLERFNERKKTNAKTQQMLQTLIDKVGGPASAPAAPAPGVPPAAASASPPTTLSYSQVAAARGAPSLAPLGPRLDFGTDYEAQRALARSALAPSRRPAPRANAEGGIVSPPMEDLAPIWVKIARMPTKSLRGHLRMLGIPTSLIHDYAFVRENTLQVIAVQHGRDRLEDCFRREGFAVFDSFDPTRPREESASAAEHEYARSSFRRQVANSVEHALSRGREGVANFYKGWLARAEKEWLKQPSAEATGSKAPAPGPAAPAAEAEAGPAPRC
ncbi:unnamed protein product [Tilletia controversa]|nr:unnamed protein product [Tilletia controversa]